MARLTRTLCLMGEKMNILHIFTLNQKILGITWNILTESRQEIEGIQ